MGLFRKKAPVDPLTRYKSTRGRVELTKALDRGKAGGRGSKAAAKGEGRGGSSVKGGVAGEPLLPADSPWRIDASRFPRTASVAEQLRFCLRFAVLAPSSHNTQPWRFRVREKSVEVWADRTRALPVCDPEDRELTISVGCAVHHLVAAMEGFGLRAKVVHRPEARQGDLLAVVSAVAIGEPSMDQIRTREAIVRRRTDRRAFEDAPVLATVQQSLVEAAHAEGGTLSIVGDAETRFRLAKLVAEADVVQFCNRGFRRELALWMHHNRTGSPDGVPGFAMGMSEMESLVAPLVVRTFDVGNSRAAKDEELALHSPLLAVLSTDRDDVESWLIAGRALSAVLLRAAREGLASSYLNQPVEIAETRLRLKSLASSAYWPQLVLRFGQPRGGSVPHTPRRKVEEVLIKDGASAGALKGRGKKAAGGR